MTKYSNDENFVLFESIDEINDYLEKAHQRDLSKMNNDELEKEHIQYVELNKKQKEIADRLFLSALERNE
ncbi:MAG: hypothetical protein CMM04_16755 [Rhodopirellula sp.]|nr:hypothetical protein [Rhodopirellula sp.]|tara:strand:+ start:5853 stop:6062 length:210 start_codon:yes stop_codon:yes gene_type:complete